MLAKGEINTLSETGEQRLRSVRLLQRKVLVMCETNYLSMGNKEQDTFTAEG